MIVSFGPGAGGPTPTDPSSVDVREVGGKALSLIRMSELGLPVPPGLVLTTDFFASWIEEIRRSPTWSKLTGSSADRWPELCARLKVEASRLPLSEAQQRVLDAGLDPEFLGASAHRLAVRSSSPEEDLDGASFAGGYETCLGVRPGDLEAAVRSVFASCLDARVLVYKQEKGFDPFAPRFAAVIQQQIAAEVAGVGFSINPSTNDYDEVLIEANWGLGESVVAGLVSPDRWVVDKVRSQVVEHAVGSKAVSIWLGADGGTEERQGERSGEACLEPDAVLGLTRLIARVEEVYGRPMDIEWAMAEQRFFLLQARPVTTFVPLPSEMLTRPGERRRLYADAALSKGMTSNEPMSVMELDWNRQFLHPFLRRHLGMDGTPESNLVFLSGARLYMNLSQMLWLMEPEKLAKASEPNDRLMAEIQAGIDRDRYRCLERPEWLSFQLVKATVKMLWFSKGILWSSLRPFWAPETAQRDYLRKAADYERGFTRELDDGQSLGELRRDAARTMFRYVFGVACPALSAGLAGLALVERLGKKRPELREATDRLAVGFEGNVVVEMGMAMHGLAHLLPASDFEDLEALSARVRQRSLPDGFLSAWDRFLELYGWRGPNEMDQASPRYADDPVLALRQISYMVGSDFDPVETHRRNVESRRQAFENLMEGSGVLRRWWLRRAHDLIERFAGARDTPKHHLVLFGYVLRRRTLMEGDRLVKEGRLDVREQVFDLTFDNLQAAAEDPSLDLRRLRIENTRFLDQVRAQVKRFPQVFDSRGRILRPRVGAEKPGELRGTAVSAGVVRGPVKVLHRPDEKPIDKGDILVAYTTDPGWTPLFVNAAAVVLEVGGLLQHGAVVAREYGKPCIVGIDRVMGRLRDGQQVEVDGNTGILRLLDEADRPDPS